MAALLFQWYGSAWPRVLPWCLANALLMVLVTMLNRYSSKELPWIDGETPLGHTMTGLIVSFLIVNRISSALNRYFQIRNHVGVILRGTRELVQKSIVFSRRGGRMKKGVGDSEWRLELAYRCLLLARTTASNFEYAHSGQPAYDAPELGHGPEKTFCAPPSDEFSRRYGVPRSRGLDSFRVPRQVIQLMRETICGQTERLSAPFPANHEMNLLASVDAIAAAYSSICNLMMTPIPFPLVQMAHTITLFYVFTLPLVFLKDTTGHLVSDCTQIFMITYGFVGLLLVAEELDDPFGEDPNDFDVMGYARFALDDVLIMIHDADGSDWADALRSKMKLDDQSAIQGQNSSHGENESLIKSCQRDLGQHASVPDWLAY